MLKTARRVCRGLLHRWRPFAGSANYWRTRYARGGDSGPGSYGELARFKAETINAFVAEHDVRTVIEFGCGDGNQLSLAAYPSYLGLDVSEVAIQRCRAAFAGDGTKRFKLVSEYAGETATLALSLDVIFHLVEDDVYEAYMRRLFDSSERFVLIYSSDTEASAADRSKHVRHRRFTSWVATHRGRDYSMIRFVRNKHPYQADVTRGSFADFYAYERMPKVVDT